MSGEDSSHRLAKWVLWSMTLIGVFCLFVGWFRLGLDWRGAVSATSCLAGGIGFVAIALLELEWLERIIGFLDGLFTGLVQWFWTSDGTLSDHLGRRHASVIWGLIGFPLFVAGCLIALRIIGF